MAYHMRRRDKEVTDPETLKRILKSAKYVTIAMARDDEAYLVSLSHGYDEDHNCIYFHCAKEGKKLDYLRANNAVWGQALLDYGYVQGECDHRYASVHFSGRVVFVEELEEKLRAVKCMMRQLDDESEKLVAGLDDAERLERLKSTVIGRINIEAMSGKKSEEVAV